MNKDAGYVITLYKADLTENAQFGNIEEWLYYSAFETFQRYTVSFLTKLVT